MLINVARARSLKSVRSPLEFRENEEAAAGFERPPKVYSFARAEIGFTDD